MVTQNAVMPKRCFYSILQDLRTQAAKDTAMLSLMNSPHPMEMLSQPESYGANGTIMRYHRITHYSAALVSLVKASD